MQFTATVPDGDYYPIQSENNTVSLLEVTNDGPGVLYYGRRIADIAASATLTNLSVNITLLTYTDTIKQGMAVTGTGIAASSVVERVEGNVVTLNNACTATGDSTDLVFTAPLDETTGVPIEVGVTKSFTPALYRQFLQQGFDLFVPSGTPNTVRILKLWN